MANGLGATIRKPSGLRSAQSITVGTKSPSHSSRQTNCYKERNGFPMPQDVVLTTHRGKAVLGDHEMLLKSLPELILAFVSTLLRAFCESEEFLVMSERLQRRYFTIYLIFTSLRSWFPPVSGKFNPTRKLPMEIQSYGGMSVQAYGGKGTCKWPRRG